MWFCVSGGTPRVEIAADIVHLTRQKHPSGDHRVEFPEAWARYLRSIQARGVSGCDLFSDQCERQRMDDFLGWDEPPELSATPR